MMIYTYAEARQDLGHLLEKARSEGEILIRNDDGQMFLVKAIERTRSPLDIEGVKLELTSDEIVAMLREARERV